MNTILRKIGNSSGVILPKELIERMGLEIGDEIALIEKDGRVELVKADDDFNRQMEAARLGMKQYHDALAKLAK